MLKSMRKSQNRYFYHIFVSPGDINHAKCCMDGKRIRCLQIVLQHVPIYLQQFPSYSNRKCKKLPFSRTTFLFPLETPLRLSRNMLHGWKENSMLTNCFAACAHLTISVSEIERDICEKIVILSYPLASTPPLGGFPSEYRHPLWCGKTRMVSLPGEKISKISLFVLT